MNIAHLLQAVQAPTPYQQGTHNIWQDEHIAKGMLEAHLAPDSDAASYAHKTIDTICRYLSQRLGLTPGAKLMDLGCGPGLYCQRFAQAGLTVTGVDMSPDSIAYARAQANTTKQSIRYVHQSYLSDLPCDNQDAILMISKDFGVLPPDQRRALLGSIYQSLKPGGSFAMDVSSIAAFEALQKQPAQSWGVEPQGYWRPHPHLWLQQRTLFNQQQVACNQFVVADHQQTAIYLIHQTYYTPQRITQEAEQAGFIVQPPLADLCGAPYSAQSAAIGLICTRPPLPA